MLYGRSFFCFLNTAGLAEFLPKIGSANVERMRKIRLNRPINYRRVESPMGEAKVDQNCLDTDILKLATNLDTLKVYVGSPGTLRGIPIGLLLHPRFVAARIFNLLRPWLKVIVERKNDAAAGLDVLQIKYLYERYSWEDESSHNKYDVKLNEELVRLCEKNFDQNTEYWNKSTRL